MVMAGRSKAEIVSAVKAAFEKKQLPSLESGAMDYMMSKSAYLTDEEGHNVPHVMFFTPVENAEDWGSGLAGYVESLLVYLAERTISNEGTATDSCVSGHGRRLV
jgi:hypothetical protein